MAHYNGVTIDTIHLNDNVAFDLAEPLKGIMVFTHYPNTLNPILNVQEMQSADISRVTPVAPLIRNLFAVRNPSYFNDYYNRIHITPSKLDLGNILSSQSRTVSVWNAFADAKTLRQIIETGTEGITLTQPALPPLIYQPLENKDYIVAISTNGPPVIDAKYIFDFVDATAELTITGRRVVVWPYIIQTKHNETLEWLTQVLDTYSGEQRLAMRKAPRQSFTYQHVMTDHDMSTAYILLEEWFQRVFGVPVWNELAHIGVLTNNPSYVDTRTDVFDYRDNDIVLIWESPDNYEAVECTSVQNNRIDFKIPVTNQYQNAYIMPLRFGRMVNPPSFTRTAMGVSKGQASFVITASVDLGSTALPQYRNLDVYNRPIILKGGSRQTIYRDVELIDNSVGEIVSSSLKDYAKKTQPLELSLDDKADLWLMRKWLHSLRGKQKPFFLPTWNADLQIVRPVAALAQSITTTRTNYHLYPRERDIMVQLVDGTVYYRRVTGVSLLPSGDESLSIDEAFDAPFSEQDVVLCCFLNLVRLNADRIELSHEVASVTNISIPTIGVALSESS